MGERKMMMIDFEGYGFLIVFMDYFGGLVLLSKLSPYLFRSEKQQDLALILFHIGITCANYLLARYLNRDEVEHTVYGARLENAVLAVGLIFLPPVILVGKGTLY